MGYDVERFVGKLNDGLLCCICRDVLEDPQQAPCEHAFCRTCILGWLLNKASCPEDRRPLRRSDLRPLFRYMKNDLERLKVKCKFFRQGCKYVSTLESVTAHEEACPQKTAKCPHEGCAKSVPQSQLEKHIQECRFRSSVCSKGCGLTVTSRDQQEHNCISELRSTIQVLRTEMLCSLDEQRKEMELRLDTQRSHMVAREAALQANIDDLKGEISKINQKVKLLLELELKRRQDIEKMHSERRELLDLLREIQSQHDQTEEITKPADVCRYCHAGVSRGGKVTTL